MKSLNLALLRPALEAAVVVARAGEQADPPVAAPGALRPYLRFARLPGPALDIARRVLDDDEMFRARVAAATSEADAGPAGWLWLTRPEGWEAQLDELRKVVAEQEMTVREERAERDARRKLGRAEDVARRAEAAAARTDQENGLLKAALQQVQAERDAFEAEFSRLNELVARLTDERASAIRQLKEVENALAQRSAELRHARHERRMVQAELDQVVGSRRPEGRGALLAGGIGHEPAAPIQAPAAGPDADSSPEPDLDTAELAGTDVAASIDPAAAAVLGLLHDDRSATTAPGRGATPSGEPVNLSAPPVVPLSAPLPSAAATPEVVPVAPDSSIVEHVVAQSIAQASAAAQQLSAALAAAARALGAGAAVEPAVVEPATVAGRELVADDAESAIAADVGTGADGATAGMSSGAVRVARTGARPGRRSSRSRHPVRLPPGLRDDSAQAADFLVRVQGMVVLVDGYNITHTAWPDETIGEQRTRLVDALNELHARTGAGIEVVFDGDEADAQSGSGTRTPIRVRFSPPGVEADDIVLALVDAYPVKLPVVVASSDRRVLDGARRRGANVVTARQLLAALNR